MALWGATDADEAKPKYLTTAQKKEVFATASGWEVEAGSAMTGNDNTSAQREVLVAIGDLATAIGAATITQIEWVLPAAAASGATTVDKSDGFTLSCRVRWNEAVTVDTSGGTPFLAVTNGNEGASSGRGPHELAYASGTGTNELIFTLAIPAANAATNEDDTLTIGANAIDLNSGTIKDSTDSVTSEITNSSAIGSAAGGVITVVA